MTLPSLPDFDSHELDAGGRMYHVHGRTHCLAYPIDDRATLRDLGGIDGIIVFAFLEADARGRPRKLGHPYIAMHPDDLVEAMEVMRAGLDPDAPRPRHKTLAQLIEERLERRTHFRIDIDVDISE